MASLLTKTRGGGAPPIRVGWLSLSREVSGAEWSLLNACQAGQSEAFLICPEGQLKREASACGVSSYTIPAWTPTVRSGLMGAARQIPNLARAIRGLRAVAKQRKPGVVAANGLRPALLAALALPHSVPVVWILHDFAPQGAVGLMSKGLSRRASAIVANSEAVAADVKARWRLRESPLIIHPGIAWKTAEHVTLRRELGVEEASPLFAVVGQITPWKGQHEAIAAARLAQIRVPNLTLLVIGSAKFRQENLAYLHELEDMGKREDWIHFLGERRDLERIYPALTALVMPSHREPFGRVAAEALGYGTPVLAYASGGIPAIVRTHEYGTLVAEGDAQGLADAMCDTAERSTRVPSQVVDAVRNMYGDRTVAARWDGLWKTVVGKRVNG